jgi:hypothetical protein
MDIALIATPLFKLIRKDSGYKSGPPEAFNSFHYPPKTIKLETSDGFS